ncbi:MAG: DUF983 domain-containing protein [Arcicella sp.]|nr:DUF983 domain-containing protein [Arcicella sp.]
MEANNIKLDIEHSKFMAISKGLCPQCREGKLFKYPLSNIRKFAEMNTNCPVCNLRFEVEPGFWYGAMFVSYANTILVLVILGVGMFYLLNDPSTLQYILIITIASILFVPFNFRISRSIFLHLFGFVKYRGVAKN